MKDFVQRFFSTPLFPERILKTIEGFARRYLYPQPATTREVIH